MMRFLSMMMLALVAMFSSPALAQTDLIPVTGRAPAPSPDDKQNLWLLDLSTGGRVTILLRPDV
ncbi:hypothetical protein, partial [Streptomyces galilaeus]|uniref:hypothetical protein n=1 Tax=Streptomyces galilaeus TaxID=33899 RepID=UPI0038F66B35